MFILVSCKSLNLGYSGCCVATQLQPCIDEDCHCDQQYYSNNDCCSDIDDFGCYPAYSSFPIVSPTPNDTLGKTKSKIVQDISHTFIYNSQKTELFFNYRVKLYKNAAIAAILSEMAYFTLLSMIYNLNHY